MSDSVKICFVTGVSSGIGNALVYELLNNGYTVFGIGRSNTIQEPNYTFISLDLRSQNAVSSFRFPQHPAQSYLLVNNAGVLGEISPVGELNAESIQEVMQVNTIAPQLLINSFIQTFSRQQVPMHVLSISSGAGKRPIDAWSVYCASKAALDIFSETVKLEMELRNRNNFFIHSVAPGVVDTKMQTQIRAASPDKFKSSQRFHDLKNNNELIQPAKVASGLIHLINAPERFSNTILSLSDI